MGNKFNKEKLYSYFNNLIHNNSKIDFMEFLLWRKKFKMYNYTWNNQMLLTSQAEDKNLTPVFATIKEWNEKENCAVAKGEKANVIIMPKLYNLYTVSKDKVSKDENGRVYGVKVFDNGNNYYFSAENKSDYFKLKKLAEEKKINKKEFFRYELVPNQFSIDQTNLPEDKRIDYLKRFETKDINPEAGEELLNNLLKVADMFNIEVIFDNEHKAHTGYLTSDNSKIYVYEEAPVESKAAILAHELGHYVMQSKIKYFILKYETSKDNYEIQAELFSKLICSYYDILGKNEFADNYISDYLDNLKSMPELCLYSSYANASYPLDREELKEKVSSCKNKEELKSVVEEFNNQIKEYVRDKVGAMKAKVFYNDFEIVDKYSKKMVNLLNALKENNQEKIDESFNDLKNLNTKDIYIDFAKDDVYQSENRKEQTNFDEAKNSQLSINNNSLSITSDFSIDKEKLNDILKNKNIKDQFEFINIVENRNKEDPIVTKELNVNYGKETIYSLSLQDDKDLFFNPKVIMKLEGAYNSYKEKEEEELKRYKDTLKYQKQINQQWMNSANRDVLISEDLYDYYTSTLDGCKKTISELEEKYPHFKEELEKENQREA